MKIINTNLIVINEKIECNHINLLHENLRFKLYIKTIISTSTLELTYVIEDTSYSKLYNKFL